MKEQETNVVTISGEIISDFSFNHEKCGEGFYTALISIERKSRVKDVLPIMVSERITDVKREWKGRHVEIIGQFRSYNKRTESGNRLMLHIFARKFITDTFEKEEPGIGKDENRIYLDGFICKQPSYRETPLGREITDILLAVNRQYGRSDYIPCVAWGRNARFAENLQVGDHISIEGRIQSREYKKKISDDEFEERIAYEVSTNKIEILEEKEDW